MCTFLKGDCLKEMTKMSDKSIDFIYFNPPFATTQNWWDSNLDWSAIFKEIFRIVKRNGTIAIHCSVPFNYTLIRAAPRAPNYSWYWDKQGTTSPLLAKKQPLRKVEEILVWTGSPIKYFPQRQGTDDRTFRSSGKSSYVSETSPQQIQTVKGFYQTHLIEMKKCVRGFATRPDELVELFIKSYTSEGDLILDPTCYKGLSGRIAKKLKRRWLGIDINFYPTEILNAPTSDNH